VEWKHSDQQKTPHLFSAVNQAMAFAGIYDYWSNGIEHILSCAIITTISAPEFEPFHPRMPVMLTPNDAELWLDEAQDTAQLYQLFDLGLPYPIQSVAIDSQYGNAQNKSKPVLLGDWGIL
jgi:putative SOS response-associated peptidase YedK